jgi:aryl-alcohol dehydrogenase-like predicted oxidoreductase
VSVDGINPFQSVQATWNLLEPSAGPALAEAHDAGWGVIIKEALANGRLTLHDRGPKRSALERIASRSAASIDALAIAAVLAQPWLDVVLSGAVTVEQLRSNLAGLEVHVEPRALDDLRALAEPPDQYWATRSSLRWT